MSALCSAVVDQASRGHRHYLANKELYAERAKAWRAANPKRRKEVVNKYGRSEKAKQKRQAWYVENKLQINLQRREKRKSYSRQVVADKFRTLVRNCIKYQGHRKASKTEQIVGCSLDFLKSHIAQQFQPGMSWENHGEWHIDHKRPCASFDLSCPTQQRAAFHYSNLQPLWAADNIRKGKSYG